MSVQGLRIHIAGSAARDTDRALLKAAHEFVSVLTERLIGAGAGLVLGAGDEPHGDEGLPCTFDWTVLDVVARARPGARMAFRPAWTLPCRHEPARAGEDPRLPGSHLE